MEPAGGAGALPVGNVGGGRNFHPGILDEDRNFEHSVVVLGRRIGILHRHHHALRGGTHFHRLGRGQTVGRHPQTRLRQHRPDLPQQQADRNRRRVPGRTLVRPARMGQRFPRKDQGIENERDQERAVGDVGGHGRVVPTHLHRHRSH